MSANLEELLGAGVSPTPMEEGGVLPLPSPPAPFQPQPQPGPTLAQSVRWNTLDTSQMVEKVVLTDEVRQRITSFLVDELDRSENLNRLVHQKAREYREQFAEYRPPKSFPWEKCSNVAVSMTAPHLNQIVAKNFRALKGTDNPVQANPYPDCPEELAQSEMRYKIEALLNTQLLDDKRAMPALWEWAVEAAIVGTGVAECSWESKKRRVRHYEVSASGQPRFAKKEVVAYEGNVINPIRTEDFFMPAEAMTNPNALQEAQWIAVRKFERMGEIWAKVRAGFYLESAAMKLSSEVGTSDAKSKKLSTFIDPGSRETASVAAPQHDSASELSVFVCYVRMPLEDEDGPEDEIVVWFHKRTETILRAVYNPYFHGERPLEVMRYLPLPNSFWGRGVCDQLKHSQQGANDIFNAAVDALTLENTPIIVTGKQSGLKPGKTDRIWPGRWITLDEPDSFRQVQIKGPSEQTFGFISSLDRFAQRASGNTDETMGDATGQGSRETAEGALTRQGAANPMADISLDEMRRALAGICRFWLSNYQQFAPMGKKFQAKNALGQPETLELQLPVVDLNGAFEFNVSISTAAANPETRKVTLQHTLATLAPLWEDILNMVAAMSSPQTPPPTRALMQPALQTKYTLLRQIALAAELPNAASMLPPWEEFSEQIIPQIEQTFQQAQQAASKPRLDDSVARHVYPSFRELFSEEQISVLDMAAIPAGATRRALAELEQQSAQGGRPGGGAPPPPGPDGPMGGSPLGGQEGPAGPPPGMPGLPPGMGAPPF